MLSSLKRPTVLIVAVAMVFIIVSRLPLKGVWAMWGCGPAIICFWLGCLLAEWKPAGFRAKLAMVIVYVAFIALDDAGVLRHTVIRLPFSWLLYPLLFRLPWLMLGWLLWPAVFDGGEVSKRDIISHLLHFLMFAVLCTWLEWSSHHLGTFTTVQQDLNPAAAPLLFPFGAYLAYLALFGMVWHLTRLALCFRGRGRAVLEK